MAHLTLEQIAALKPLPDPSGRKVPDVLRELNAAMVGAGIEFGENEFSDLITRFSQNEQFFEHFRWIDIAAVRGGNEGYYIHITLVPSNHDRVPGKLIASAKTWTWASALEISAAATRLLCDY